MKGWEYKDPKNILSFKQKWKNFRNLVGDDIVEHTMLTVVLIAVGLICTVTLFCGFSNIGTIAGLILYIVGFFIYTRKRWIEAYNLQGSIGYTPLFCQIPIYILDDLGRPVINPEYVEKCRKRKERFCTMEIGKEFPVVLTTKDISALQVGDSVPVHLGEEREDIIGKAEIVEREGGKECLITLDMTTPGARKVLGLMNKGDDVSMGSRKE